MVSMRRVYQYCVTPILGGGNSGTTTMYLAFRTQKGTSVMAVVLWVSVGARRPFLPGFAQARMLLPTTSSLAFRHKASHGES